MYEKTLADEGERVGSKKDDNSRININKSITIMSERKTIYLCLAHMSEEGWEQKYVKEAFDTNWVVPMGPNVNAFEKYLADFVNKNDNEDEKAGA